MVARPTKIRAFPDVSELRDPEDDYVVIYVEVDSSRPFSGRIVAEGCDAIAFIGWLDFLRTMSELLESAPDDPVREGKSKEEMR